MTPAPPAPCELASTLPPLPHPAAASTPRRPQASQAGDTMAGEGRRQPCAAQSGRAGPACTATRRGRLALDGAIPAAVRRVAMSESTGASKEQETTDAPAETTTTDPPREPDEKPAVEAKPPEAPVAD